MESVDIDQLATRADIADVKVELGGLRTEVTRLDHRMDLLRERMDRQFETLRADLRAFAAEITAAYRGELVAAVSGQTRALIFTMLGTVITVGGMALGLSTLT